MFELKKTLCVLAGCCIVFGSSIEALADDYSSYDYSSYDYSSNMDIEYEGSSANSAAADGISSFETVLIRKHSDGSIAYVGQTDGGFSSTADTVRFLLKEESDYGLYDVVFGNSNGDYVTKYFWIGVDAPTSSDVPMRRLVTTLTDTTTGNTYYTAGFYAEVDASDYASYNALKVGYNNGSETIYGALKLKNGSGFPRICSGSLMLMFELTEIEADELDSVSVFLSPATVGEASAYR